MKKKTKKKTFEQSGLFSPGEVPEVYVPLRKPYKEKRWPEKQVGRKSGPEEPCMRMRRILLLPHNKGGLTPPELDAALDSYDDWEPGKASRRLSDCAKRTPPLCKKTRRRRNGHPIWVAAKIPTPVFGKDKDGK